MVQWFHQKRHAANPIADDLDNPTPFCRFAWKRMANHVSIELRKHALLGDDILADEADLDAPPAAGSSSDAAHLEHMHTPSGEASHRAACGATVELQDAREREHTLGALERARAELDCRSAAVIHLKGARTSWAQVAGVLEISQATARRDHAAALQQLRRSLTAASVSIECVVTEGGSFPSDLVRQAENGRVDGERAGARVDPAAHSSFTSAGNRRE